MGDDTVVKHVVGVPFTMQSSIGGVRGEREWCALSAFSLQPFRTHM